MAGLAELLDVNSRKIDEKRYLKEEVVLVCVVDLFGCLVS